MRMKFCKKRNCMVRWNEKTKKWVKPRKKKSDNKFDFSRGFTVMPDITEFQSPIDGSMISSRSQLRAHERRHNVRQAGDFKPGELIKRENERVAKTREQAQGASFKWM